MPNPNPNPNPIPDGYQGRDFRFSDLENDYLQAVFQIQACALAFSRVGAECVTNELAKGNRLAPAEQMGPAVFVFECLRLCMGLVMACSNHATEADLRNLMAAMDPCLECVCADVFEEKLQRVRDLLLEQTEAKKSLRDKRRAAARCN